MVLKRGWAIQAETRFKLKVQEELKRIPFLWQFKTQQLCLLGIPDIIGCYKGKFFAWELKRNEKERPTRLQAHVLASINLAGGVARVVHPGNLDESIKELIGPHP
jgi:hypothetical protein